MTYTLYLQTRGSSQKVFESSSVKDLTEKVADYYSEEEMMFPGIDKITRMDDRDNESDMPAMAVGIIEAEIEDIIVDTREAHADFRKYAASVGDLTGRI